MREVTDEQRREVWRADVHAEAVAKKARVTALREAHDIATQHPDSPQGGYGGNLRRAELNTSAGIAFKIAELIEMESDK